MRVDPAVTLRKYDQEVSRLAVHRELLERRGIFVLAESAFPFVWVYFAPRGPLRLIFTPPPGVSVPFGAAGLAEIPHLGAIGFKVRFDLTDYDLHAPSLEFFDQTTNRPLEFAAMFRAVEYEKQRGVHDVLLGGHPATKRPFLCVRGVREYHEHFQHTGDEWLLYRADISLFALVTTVWRVAIDLARPQLVVSASAGGGNVQLQWVMFGAPR